jgi:hypothetical protein
VGKNALLWAAAALGGGILLWWIFRKSGPIGFGTRSTPGSDPYAAAGAVACAGAAAYFGQGAGGLAAMPLCMAAGGALAPTIKAGSDLSVGLINDAGNLSHNAVNLVSGALESAESNLRKIANAPADVVGDVYGAGKDVVSDVYGAGKDVVSDVYHTGKDIVTAPVKVVNWLGGLF